ncbi:hypothetical protein [Campylobacter geochelonis]|uniref:Entericidin EcnAB n=1 Tax=Campylobacter geochelonis TaxID=1780362 RepID=A0A128EAZ4_9BACT|nr:hypothetical protein [Campylobacter geochelonis]QKF72221.1 hypothetical protein CGEO_1959 [Campylobacter geochelonis]CZE46140.1 Uncharacterised protein [Campylobacter geochelonis]CZE46487.1 Uncharacterised protein [Campylobacter geochelonis]CZE50779.1 Uncharacterised protein [Campylobacter geochelonis]
MRFIFAILVTTIFFVGCSNTWQGVKQDSKETADWTKEKVNEGATFVKEKTE